MTYHILPRLKPDHTVQNINNAGTWEVRTRQLLEDLGKGLHVDRVESEINSIPDMWARPMLFEMALLDRDHVLHPRIRGEWRGLLAMIALKEVAKLDRLSVSQVKVPDLVPVPEGEEETEAQQRDFMRTLSKLVPKSSLASDTSWRSLYIFLFNGQPIGMTSPTTLVTTAADYLNRISNQEVPWYNGTHLKDPVKILPPSHRRILAGWLNHLVMRLESHPGCNADRLNLVSGLLKTFRDELGVGECTLSQAGLEIHGQEAGIFKYLDKPADGNLQDASHVQVIPSEGRSAVRPLLVFDRSIAEQWEMAAQDVTVHGAQTLASPRIDLNSADVWKAEDFFTRTLFVVFQENAFRGTLSASSQSLTLPGGSSPVTPILPLNADLLKQLSGEDLAKNVRWDQTPNGLRLRLLLKLTGPDPQHPGRTIELTKTYSSKEIQTLNNVPILEVWPNFRSDRWKAYYTCYSADDATSTFVATPFALGAVVNSEVDLTAPRQRRYWRTETYPEAMVCTGHVANTESNQMEIRDAGLLLLAQPPTRNNKGLRFRVGVDFGASSTTVCAIDSEEPFLVDFADRNTSITASGDVAQARLFDFFLPRKASEMPVLSFFQDFKNNTDGTYLQPFLDGHAYLLETAERFDPEAEGLAFDLKWSREKEDRRRAHAFLSQLCLQTAAELFDRGGSSADWAFSYPTAFSGEQIQGFGSLWAQVTEDCAAKSGLKQTSKNQRLTESEATAFYFVRSRKAATEYGSLFMDIGGSTTDISVWQGGNPIWQTSVLLAGRSIFSNYLWHNPGFLSLFGPEFHRLPELRTKTGDNRKPYHALTDALLRYKTNEIFKQLALVGGTEDASALRQHLALGISGLFFYLGSLLQYLTNKGIYSKAIPNVYVGGNGSRIFRWLDIDEDGQINGLYKAALACGAGWKEEKPFDVFLSPAPKTEAAFGLVSGLAAKGGSVVPRVLAGEVFVAEESIPEISEQGSAYNQGANVAHKVEWDTLLTSEALLRKLAPPIKLERLTEFIDHFNAYVRKSGIVSVAEFNSYQVQEVLRRLGESLARYRGLEDPKDIVVEPVFILALRHFLEVRLGG